MLLLRSLVLSCALATTAFANPNGVGQLPVMGWSGYNAFMQNSGHCDRAGAGGYNESTFLESMDALKATGLSDLGYVYINADDCWIAENRTADGKLTHDVSRFPRGMAWLAGQAHARRLKLGLYAAASVETCRRTRTRRPLLPRVHRQEAATDANHDTDLHAYAESKWRHAQPL